MTGVYTAHPSPRTRIAAALLTAAIAAAIGWALIAGLAVRRAAAAATDALAVFTVAPPLPPPRERIVPRRKPIPRREGAAAPPNLRSTPTELVAPPPIVPTPPPPMVVAPVAGAGSDASVGAAEKPGPGTGAGGIGDGRGSGGDGDGDGSGDGEETEPRWLRGRLTYADAARLVGEAALGRKLSARCTLEVTGRVTRCVVTHSSGLATLDEGVLRIFEQRYRYTPWLDAQGRPVESFILLGNEWNEER